MGQRRFSWAETVAMDRTNSALHKEREKKERADRLAHLFGDDYNDGSSDEMEVALDQKAAQTSINKIADKIETHLAVEMHLLHAWKENDEDKEEQARAAKDGEASAAKDGRAKEEDAKAFEPEVSGPYNLNLAKSAFDQVNKDESKSRNEKGLATSTVEKDIDKKIKLLK